jgi:hypothetical protein
MDRIARYSGLKNRSALMAKHIKAISLQSPKDRTTADLARKVSECAHYLLFHDYYTIEQLRLVKAITCKKTLLCPFCAARRAAKQVEKNLPRVAQILASNPSLKPVMITLTVKNGESLAERYQHLKESYARLQQRRRDCLKGQAWSEFSRVAGAIHSYEFTKSSEGWHPHIHIVALLHTWIDQPSFSREWYDITGDSFIVDVRRILPGSDGLASAMLEVFKYSLKFQDLDLHDTWHAHTVLNKRRLIGCFGVLRGIQEPDSLLDDPFDDLPYHAYLYVFSHRTGAYDLRATTFHVHDSAEPLTPVYGLPPSPLLTRLSPSSYSGLTSGEVKGSGREPRSGAG